MPKGVDPATTAAHHTPDFFVDESSMKTGVKAYCYLVLDYMNKAQAKTSGKKVSQKSF
jgi:amidohydrolase